MPLARRIIPVILARGQQAVKGKGFDSWRSVGQLRQAIRVYEMRGVDEVCLLDIGATPAGRGPNVEFVREFAGEFFCPVTVGGGVRTVEHFRQLLAAGADKVAINTAAVETPDLIDTAANKFGAQAVVVSIDVRVSGGVYNCDGGGWFVYPGMQEVFTRSGKNPTGRSAVDWAKEVADRGAGEILLNCVDRDGTMQGYDLDLITDVSKVMGIPAIACGGAGSYEDFRLAIEAGAHAVAAGAIWHFTDCTPAGAAEYLAQHDIPVRRKAAA